jgi:exopolysaccharide production protein ExoF
VRSFGVLKLCFATFVLALAPVPIGGVMADEAIAVPNLTDEIHTTVKVPLPKGTTFTPTNVSTTAGLPKDAAGTLMRDQILKPLPTDGSQADVEVASLGDADRLTIKFQRYENLSGDYRVSADNTISIPGLGLISIGAKTAMQLKVELGDLILKAGGSETDISVEIAQYRPVFITGAIRNAGSYPWRPGMTVLHVETLSGGIVGPSEANNSLAIDEAAVRQKKAEVDLKRALATLARLTAERKGLTVILIPDELIKLAGPAEAADLVNDQNTALLARQNSLDAQMASMQAGAKLAHQEIADLKDQLSHVQENIAARKAILADVDALAAKKIVPIERKLEEQSKVADLEEKLANLSVGIVRAEGTELGLLRDVETLQRDRQSATDADIFKLQTEVAQLRIEIESAKNTQKKLGAGSAVAGNAETGLRYEILRTNGAQQQVIPATRLTRLRPGDVVVVSIVGPGGSQQPSNSASVVLPGAASQ